MKSFTTLLLEGKSIESALRKKFPDVIFQLLGPRPPEDGENGYYVMQMIVVPFKMRRQGLADKFMKELVDLAKKEKRDIFLTTSADYQEPNEMTKNDLAKWYKKVGFVKKNKDDFRAQHSMVFYSK